MERAAADQGTRRSSARHRAEALCLERRQVAEDHHLCGRRQAWLLGSSWVFEYGPAVGRGPVRVLGLGPSGIRIERDQALSNRQNGRLRAVIHLQLMEDVADVILHRLFAQV